jgi:biotin carboxyl carrier protein
VRYIATVNGREYVIDLEDGQRIRVDGRTLVVDMRQIEPSHLYSLLVDSLSYEMAIEEMGHTFRVMLDGDLFEVRVEDERTRRLASAGHQLPPAPGEIQVKAPIPGLVTRLLATAGDAVAFGQPLLCLEAMKMENELRAPRAGTVGRVAVEPGQRVEQGQLLLTIH